MKWGKTAKNISKSGKIVDIEEIEKRLGVSRNTAINYIYELRKRGLVETERGKNGKRLYVISSVKRRKSGHPGLYEIINKYSPIKIIEPVNHIIHDHELSVEEAIIRAVLTKDFRVILSSLALFKNVSDWSLLYKFTKEHGIQRAVGALYDLSRHCMRVRKMDGRIRKSLKVAKTKSKYIIPGLKTGDFAEIENEWGVFIPFKFGDINRYKEHT